MTTERQRAANQANARKSTGPKTKSGKRRSSRNAQKHGLTRPPERALVEPWYQVVLEDPSVRIDPLDQDPIRRAALRLAEAEAHLQNVIRVETTELKALSQEEAGTQRQIARLTRTPIEDPDWLDAAKFLIRQQRSRLRARHRTAAKLTRYRAEAEARRRKALQHWLEINGE